MWWPASWKIYQGLPSCPSSSRARCRQLKSRTWGCARGLWSSSAPRVAPWAVGVLARSGCWRGQDARRRDRARGHARWGRREEGRPGALACAAPGPPRPDPHLCGAWPVGSGRSRRSCSPLYCSRPLGRIRTSCGGSRERRRRIAGGRGWRRGRRGGDQGAAAGGGGRGTEVRVSGREGGVLGGGAGGGGRKCLGGRVFAKSEFSLLLVKIKFCSRVLCKINKRISGLSGPFRDL
jgi:hypothetical protein